MENLSRLSVIYSNDEESKNLNEIPLAKIFQLYMHPSPPDSVNTNAIFLLEFFLDSDEHLAFTTIILLFHEKQSTEQEQILSSTEVLKTFAV